MLFLLGILFTLCAGAAGALYILKSRKKLPDPAKDAGKGQEAAPKSEQHGRGVDRELPKPESRPDQQESLDREAQSVPKEQERAIASDAKQQREAGETAETEKRNSEPKLTRSASNSSQSSEVKSSRKKSKKRSDTKIDTDTTAPLNSTDLRLLFGKKKHPFFAGERLVLQSETSAVVLVLSKGKCSLNRTNKSEEPIQPLYILGDRSMFQLGNLHSVFADGDVQCYSTPASQLLENLQEHPYSAVRFFRALAAQLSHELSKKNVADTVLLTKKKGLFRRGGDSPETLLQKKFSLKDVKVIGSANVMFNMAGKNRAGKLMLTVMGLFFYSKILGMSYKESISTGSIISCDAQKREEYKLTFRSSGLEKTVTLTPLYKKDKDDFEDLMDKVSSLRSEADLVSSPRVANLRHMQNEMTLTEDDWETILTSDPTHLQRDVTEGETIFEAGQEHGSLFQVLSGSCRILVDGREVAVLGPGETFGELQFMTGNRCTASAVGTADTVLIEIPSDHINGIIFNEHPQTAIRFYYYLCSIAQKRLSPV